MSWPVSSSPLGRPSGTGSNRPRLDDGQRQDGLTTAEKQELARLRKQVKQLRLEREILAKAAAWFARETDAVPPKSSSS